MDIKKFRETWKQIEIDCNRIFLTESKQIRTAFIKKFTKAEDLEKQELLASLKNSTKGQDSLAVLEIDGNRIGYEEDFMAAYSKVMKIFADFADTQCSKYDNELRSRDGEDNLGTIWSWADTLLEDAYDLAFDILKKLGVDHFSRDEIKKMIQKQYECDLEAVFAPYYRIFELALLRLGKKQQVRFGDGRTEMFQSIYSVNTSLIQLGWIEEESVRMGLPSVVFESREGKQKKITSEYLNRQIIEIGKFVVNLLIQEQKIQRQSVAYDADFVYETYLQEFLDGSIKAKQLEEILWMLAGSTIEKEQIQTGILYFLKVHNKAAWKQLQDWNQEHYLFYNVSSEDSDNIFYLAKLSDAKFEEQYADAALKAKYDIETRYYLKRHNAVTSGTTDIKEKNVPILELNCEKHKKELDSRINELNQMKHKVSLEYGKTSKVKKRIDVYAGQNQLDEMVRMIDGKNAYPEWAICQICTKKHEALLQDVSRHKDVKSIYRVLSESQRDCALVDHTIQSILASGEQPDLLKTLTLNVLRAMCNLLMIRIQNKVWNFTDREICAEDRREYQRKRSEYKQDRENMNFQLTMQCKRLIKEGAKKGVALACFLMGNDWTSEEISEQQRKVMVQVGVGRHFPASFLDMGKSILEDGVQDFPMVYEAYYYFSVAAKLGITEAECKVQRLEEMIYGGFENGDLL